MADEFDEYSSPVRFTINCTNIPDALFESGDAAENHFGKFGTVTKIVLQPKKRACLIEYESREAAEKAVLDAGAYDGFMFDVKLNKKRRPKTELDPEWLPDPDVAAELAALNRNNPSLPRLNRQQKMDLDPQSSMLLQRKKPILKKVLNKNIERKRTKSVTKGESKPIKTTKIVAVVNSEEIKQLISKQWISIEDKLVALEIRDKLLRANLPKRQGALKGCCPDMCPERERLLRQSQQRVAYFETSDSDSNKLMPERAVKEYSRSSADQEEPLAHELRPVPVLHFTLLYILHHISNLCDDLETSLSDWFHFMWDRLRAIRKDITQQALCCKGSVLLVEACARFHAHCAARLVEEPPSSFDQRLNTENLSKCLQSLKYMYNDLRIRGDVEACKNEAEFRAYVILLNMQDSNFMWEVQQLSSEVQSSKEVCFAIKIFTALDNNNYVKFFKLVKQTTYLNACILMRYFNNVRVHALKRLIKAYSPRGISYFPATELMDMLAFEGLESMRYFLNNCGLEMESDQNGQFVVLDKNNFQYNMIPNNQERAFNLVESKRKCQLGEMIYGSSLPENDHKYYLLHSSFDHNNYFKKESILAEDQGNVPPIEVVSAIRNVVNNINKPENAVVKPNLEVKVNNSGEVQKIKNFIFAEPKKTSSAASLFKSAIEMIPNDNNMKNDSAGFAKPQNNFIFSKPAVAISAPVFQPNQMSSNNIFGKMTNDNVQPPPQNIFGSVASDLFNAPPKKNNNFEFQPIFGGNVSKDTFQPNSINQNKFNIFEKANANLNIPLFNNNTKMEEEKLTIENENKKKEEEKRIQEEMKREELRQKEIQKAIEKEKEALEQAKRQAEFEKKEKERKDKEFEEMIEEQSNKLSPEIITEIISEVCLDVIKEEIDRLNKVNNLAKSNCEDIISTLCKEECEEALLVAKRLLEIRHRILARFAFKAWRNTVMKSRRRHLLLVNTPSWIPVQPPPSASSNQSDVLERMRKFHRGILPNIKLQDKKSINKINVIEEVKKNLFSHSRDIDKSSFSMNIFWKVTVSSLNTDKDIKIKKFFNKFINDALVDVGRKAEDSLIYLKEAYSHKKLHVSIGRCSEDVKLNSKSIMGTNGMIFFGCNEQHSSLLENMQNMFDCKSEYHIFPIVLICYGKDESIKIKNKLVEFKNDGMISSFKISIIKQLDDVILSDITKEALKWLSKHIPKKPSLEVNELHSFLEQCLGKELWYRFKSGLQSSIREAFKNIQTVIGIYNEAVDKVIKIACHDNLQKYPNFAQEFKQYLINSFVYPKDFEYMPQNWKTNINMLKNLINGFKMINYEYEWPPSDWESFQSSIKEFVHNLKWFKNPQKVFLKVLSLFVMTDIEGKELKIDSSSWLDIMQVLITEKIIEVCSVAKDEHFANCLKVVYSKRDLDYYRNTPWWYRSPLIKNISMYIEEVDPNFLDDTIEDLGICSSKRARLDSTVDSIPDDKWLSAVMTDLDESYKQKSICNEMMDELEKSIESESMRQMHIEEYLNSLLNR